MARFCLAAILALMPAVGAEASTDWVLAIVGHGEVRFEVAGLTTEGKPIVDARVLAPLLGLTVDESTNPATVRDSAGGQWPLVLASPELDSGPAISLIASASPLYVALGTLIEARGHRMLVADNRRVYVFPDGKAVTEPAAQTPALPAAVKAFTVPKSPTEIAEMLRLEGLDTPASTTRPAAADTRLAPQHEAIFSEVGAGVVSGVDGALDWNATGTINGFAAGFEGFVAMGHAGIDVRTIRGRLEHPDGRWMLEGGDLISELRGLSRGVRGHIKVGERWRPGVGLYIDSDQTELAPRVVSYRDSVFLTDNSSISGEVTSDRSVFVEGAHVFRRSTIESYYRRLAGRQEQEYGGFLTVDIGRGFSLNGGTRFLEGPLEDERWFSGGIRIPVTERASVSLDRTHLLSDTMTRHATSVAVLLPIGPVRIMQRYQWADLDLLLRAPTGQRQSQSSVFYSPHRRLQLSYQSVTQWYKDGTPGQWDQVEATAQLTRGTTLHGAARVPDLSDSRYLNVRLSQELPRRFRATIEYGAIAAFHPRTLVEPGKPRLLLMLHRRFDVFTPAAGGNVRGTVLDDLGRPADGAIVRLGEYRAVTDVEGRYNFGRVPPGQYALDVNPEKLEASLVATAPPVPVTVTRGSAVAIDLRVDSLASVGGLVYVDANLNGRPEPYEGLSGAVVLLAGRATMTDDRGYYRFHNLPAGTYRIQLDTGRLRRDLSAASPTTVEVEVAPNAAPAAANFRVVSRGRITVMQEQP